MKDLSIWIKIAIKRLREYAGLVQVIMIGMLWFKEFSDTVPFWATILIIMGTVLGSILFLKWEINNILGQETDEQLKKSEIFMELYKAAKVINEKDKNAVN